MLRSRVTGFLFAPRRSILLAVHLPLMALLYFGTLAWAAAHFPVPYDWRYRVISNLLSPRDDPQWFRLPSVGIALAGLLMLPIGGFLEDRLHAMAAGWARLGALALRCGAVLLILSALVVPQHVNPVLGLKHLHEALSRLAAAGFTLAMLACCVCGWRDRRAARLLDRRLLPVWAGLTLLPLVGIAASEVLLFAARAFPVWGQPIKEALRHSVLWHLGFWEWLGSVAVFAFLVISVALLPGGGPGDGARRAVAVGG